MPPLFYLTLTVSIASVLWGLLVKVHLQRRAFYRRTKYGTQPFRSYRWVVFEDAYAMFGAILLVAGYVGIMACVAWWQLIASGWL